jgi:hypothetical protein
MSGVPPLVDVLVAVLALVGAVAALLGSLGLVTLRSFFQRVHAPTTASTLGTWSIPLATTVQVSFLERAAFAHALVVRGGVPGGPTARVRRGALLRGPGPLEGHARPRRLRPREPGRRVALGSHGGHPSGHHGGR